MKTNKQEVESLKPQITWIPQSEQDYLQRQKLLPVFQGWLNQVWKVQKPYIEQALQTAYEAGREENINLFKGIRNNEDVRAHQSNDNCKHYAVGVLDRVLEALTNPNNSK